MKQKAPAQIAAYAYFERSSVIHEYFIDPWFPRHEPLYVAKVDFLDHHFILKDKAIAKLLQQSGNRNYSPMIGFVPRLRRESAGQRVSGKTCS